MAGKSSRVSVSKSKLADTAVAAGVVGVETEMEGAVQVVEGVETLQAAQEVGTIGKAALAAGASDLTRAADLGMVADRMARLSNVVAAAGVLDMAEGADMLAASQDVEVQSDLVAVLERRRPEIRHGPGRDRRQLGVAADIAELRDMPILAEFLADKGDELRDLAVDAILKFAAARALAGTIAATGAKIGGMGADEMVEGLARLSAAEAVAQRSDELAMAGVGLCCDRRRRVGSRRGRRPSRQSHGRRRRRRSSSRRCQRRGRRRHGSSRRGVG